MLVEFLVFGGVVITLVFLVRKIIPAMVRGLTEIGKDLSKHE